MKKSQIDVTVTLPWKCWETIIDAVGSYQDEGPLDEGWASGKLEDACERLSSALSIATNGKIRW